jgi:Ser/Thr protein kinase RdoA (MazF antagonist)
MTELDVLLARYSPAGYENLGPHLESTYGIRVSSVTRLDGGVFRVDRHDGPSWVARVFPAERGIEAVKGDAEILRFLEERDYPAERWAHADAVSTLARRGVLVTQHVGGSPADDRETTAHELGALLGRLQSLPDDSDDSDAVAREAGSLHHWSENGGGPREDLSAAMSWLAEVDGRVSAPHRTAYETLRDEVASADDLEGLPLAFVHPDFQVGNAIATLDTGLVIIDWAGSGRGPRIAALATLLFIAVEGFHGHPPRAAELDRVDAVIAGYRAHIRLDDEEQARLAAALRRLPLVFACFLFCVGVKTSGTPGTRGPWSATRDLSESIATRVREVIAA